jgi:flagellar basal-body rod protein FlgG
MLLQAVYTSDTGVIASQALLDTAGNNLANLNTTSFKANKLGFQDLFYATLQAAGPPKNPGGGPVVPTQSGYGVRLSSTSKLFAQGPLESTGVPLDVAINGNGFFQLARADGSTVYTRNGAFQLDPNGRLVAADGSIVQPPITVPSGTLSVNIAADGTVTVNSQSAPDTFTPIGQLTLVRFANPPGLTALGGNVYAASQASGSPTVSVPGQNGTGTLVQGFLEGSNVDPTTELINLLIAQQSYVFNAQAIQIANQMLTDTAATLVPT